MNPIAKNEETVKQYKKYFKYLEGLGLQLNHKWAHNNNMNIKKFVRDGESENRVVRPIYNERTRYPQPAPHLYMVEVGKVGILTKGFTDDAHIPESVCGVVKDGVLTLMNITHMYDEQIDALCCVLGGGVTTDSTTYPLNPKRYRVKGADKDVPLADGMQVTFTPEGATKILTSAKDYKVRSDRKVTYRVNKVFKEYMANAYAMADLMRLEKPEGARYNWDDEPMLNYAKMHLGLNQRIHWASRLEGVGLINNPQKLFGNSFAPTIDPDTGTITPTKNFDVPKLINEAAKINNFAPMAYILLENPGTSTEKRLLNAIRALEGGFRIGEV